ncbi:hypothetical protein LCGC14_1433810 [marine sediment metagenome]|uniref:Uncharacterized protein n=1 Tax=marine sediment metagenome TaxID=412755 RepID=A0A0F9M397_9ZZZZ
MEIEMKEVPRLNAGVHTGQIIEVKYDTEPYQYTRIVIKPDDKEFTLEYSCPTNLSDNTKLMTLLTIFGATFEVGKKIDPETFLKDKKIQFQTVDKPNKKDSSKTFSEVVEGSIKPLPSA